MKSKGKVAKYQQLQKRIVADIAKGIHPVGEKLPSCREMAKTFKVSYLTVITAMRGLEERGLVQRVPGSGIFISDPNERETTVSTSNSTVGSLMPLTGDLFQNFAESIIDGLESQNFQLVALPTKGVLGLENFSGQEEIIADLAGRGLDAFIIEGTRHVPYRLLRKYQNGFRNLTFAIHYESGVDFPEANSVTCDYRRVGEMAAEHLLESGSAKIAMLTFEPITEIERRSNGTTRDTHESQIIDGIESVLNSAGMKFNDHFDLIIDETVLDGNSSTSAKVATAIKNGFNGFFCLGDHRARSVYQAAAELDMRIGSDLNVLGMYDTKWAAAFSPSLPSIFVNEQEIAKIAAELITSKTYGERIIVQPAIVTHASRLIPSMSSNRLGCSPTHPSSLPSCPPEPRRANEEALAQEGSA